MENNLFGLFKKKIQRVILQQKMEYGSFHGETVKIIFHWGEGILGLLSRLIIFCLKGAGV